MKFIVSNNIRVIEPDHKMLKYCSDNLYINNPDFYKKQAMGKWTGNTPEKIWLYEKDGNDLLIPFGRLKSMWKMYPQKDMYDIQIKPIQSLEYKSNINLYDYQKEAVIEAIRSKNGILVMPCGSGKTQCGIEIIARLKGKALWLTHTQDLLNQSMSRAKSVLDIPNSCYGTITGGKINIGTHITFATVQTMCNIDLNKYKDCFDIVIVDECQRCAGSPTKVTQFYKVVSNLSARYKYGLTATPKRADGLEQSMFALLGGIIHEVSREDVKHTTCPVRVLTYDTGYMPDYDAVLRGDGTIDYMKLVDDLIHDEDRFKFVLTIIEQLPAHAPTLVLANRIEYLRELNRYYYGRSNFLSATGASKRAKEERKRALEALNNGDIDCLFASYKLASEGLDCPNLRYIVLATPEKDPTIIEQSTGRVARKADGKECGTVIDFMDDFGMYKSWYKKRLAIYNRLKYDII